MLDVSDAVPALADLAWERRENARRATARLFDLPGSPEALETVVSLEVSGSDPWGVALHAAWIAGKLGWKRVGVSNDGSGPWRRRNGAAATVTLGRGALPRCVFGFADGSSSRVEFSDGREAALVFPDGTRQDMLFPAPDDGLTLARLIDAPLADPLYSEALSALAGI